MSAGTPVKSRPKVDPTYIGSATNGGSTGTSGGPTLPTVANGDFVMGMLTCSSVATVTVPTGMTEIARSGTYGSNGQSVFYAGTVNAADSGTVQSWTFSGNTGPWASALSVYRNVGGYSVAPRFRLPHALEAPNFRAARFASLDAGPDDMIVGLVGASPTTSAAAANGEMTVAPSGFTIRATESRINGIVLPVRGANICDAPGATPLQTNTFTIRQNSHNVSVICALSPVKPRWSDSEHIPNSQAGKPIVVYSTSSSAYVKQPELNFGYNSANPWGEQIMDAAGDPANSFNYAMPGAKSYDICTGLYGTSTYSTRAVSGEDRSIVRVITNLALPNRSALYVTDLIGNNIVDDVDGPKSQAGVVHSVRAMFRRMRASAVAASGVLTYTGTWTAVTSTGVTNGGYRYSATPGDAVSLAVNNTTGAPFEWEFVVLIGDNDALGHNYSTYKVQLDGVDVPGLSGTTHNQMLASGWGGGNDYKFCQMVIPVTVPTGAHTIRLVHTGASGDRLNIDSIQVGTPGGTPPWIVTNILPELMPDAYVNALLPNLNLAKQNAYNALLEGVVNEFTDKRVILNRPALPLTSDYFCSDGVHQTEMGHAKYAHDWINTVVPLMP